MFQETLILTLAYIFVIGLLYAPKCPHAVSPDSPVDYFPEIENEPTQPDPVAIVETPLPVEPTAIATVTHLEALPSNELKVIATVATSPVTDLKTLTSKELKAIARNQKIPRYGSLTKKQLLLALT